MSAHWASLWVWLFPGTYAIHLVEEAYGGEGFGNWARHLVGRSVRPLPFWIVSCALWLLMAVAVVVPGPPAYRLLLMSALGCIVGSNAIVHLVGTLVTRVYSPGLVTGLLCWLPLGTAALWRSWQTGPQALWWLGVVAGVAVHGCVAIVLFVLGTPSGLHESVPKSPALLAVRRLLGGL